MQQRCWTLNLVEISRAAAHDQKAIMHVRADR